MVIFPRAKINIGLRIVNKRVDGFHNIETILYPIELRDALEFIVPSEPFEEDHIVSTGIITDCSPSDNLIIKALIRFRKQFPIPFLNIHLHKAIPVGAGLGGGSSDAASIMKCVNRFFNAGLETEVLKTIASELGSDCPFFIESVPVLAEGRGEILKPIPVNLRGYYLILTNPAVKVSTIEAYRNCIPKKPSSNLNDLVAKPLAEWKDLIVNDFEETVFREYPVIKSFKEELYNIGAIFSSMSGSGSAVYGIFDHKPEIPAKMIRNVIYSGVL